LKPGPKIPKGWLLRAPNRMQQSCFAAGSCRSP
jgi:hypothetical protein